MPDTSSDDLPELESYYDYRPGGLRPVAIGDALHGRYRILHALGHGAFSTVWLAKDQHYNQQKSRVMQSDSRIDIHQPHFR